MSEKAKASQIQVAVSGASDAGTLQELIEDRKIFRPANLTVDAGEYNIAVKSSTGTSATIPAATVTTAGAMSKDDKAKLVSLPTAEQIGTALGEKVDKVVGYGLISSGQSGKLDDLPTAVVIGTALGEKVDKVAGKGLIEPSPVDGKQYAQKDGSWSEVTSSGGGGTGGVEEAPEDGKIYGRKDAAWEEVASGGGGDVEEAPVDGGLYMRSGGTWQRFIGEQIVYTDYPLESGIPHKFTVADFPDASFVYQGSAETENGVASYRAEYMTAMQFWIVELKFQIETFKVAFLGGEPHLIASKFQYGVAPEYLPSDLTSIVYRGKFDLLAGGNSDITFSVDSSYVADTVTETLAIPKASISISTDDIDALFTSLNTSLAPDTVSLTKRAFAYGFGKGKMYREASFDPQDSGGNSLKISFQSEQSGVAALSTFEVPVPSIS